MDFIVTLKTENNDNNVYPNIIYDNIPNNVIDINKINPSYTNYILGLMSRPTYNTAPLSVILSLQEDKGLYIATDNGHWYYWKETKYTDGGIFQSPIEGDFDKDLSNISDNVVENKIITNYINGNHINPIFFNGELKGSLPSNTTNKILGYQKTIPSGYFVENIVVYSKDTYNEITCYLCEFNGITNTFKVIYQYPTKNTGIGSYVQFNEGYTNYTGKDLYLIFKTTKGIGTNEDGQKTPINYYNESANGFVISGNETLYPVIAISMYAMGMNNLLIKGQGTSYSGVTLKGNPNSTQTFAPGVNQIYAFAQPFFKGDIINTLKIRLQNSGIVSFYLMKFTKNGVIKIKDYQFYVSHNDWNNIIAQFEIPDDFVYLGIESSGGIMCNTSGNTTFYHFASSQNQSGGWDYTKDGIIQYDIDMIIQYRKNNDRLHDLKLELSNNFPLSFYDALKIYIPLIKDLTIYVDEGTYDLSNIVNFTDIPVFNGVHLIFSPKSLVTFKYTGSDSTFATDNSPFRSIASDYGDFIVEGLNISVSRMRYCFHDELAGDSRFAKHVFKNCRMYLDNSNHPNPSWVSTTRKCIGGGLGLQTEIIIEDCYFESVVSDDELTRRVVTYHNCFGNAESTIVFKNNYIKEGTFACGYYGDTTRQTIIWSSNNSFTEDCYVYQEQSGVDTPNMTMYKWNNFVRSN